VRCLFLNLWRDIPPGDDPPRVLNAVVEVISRSRDKYEYNRRWEAFFLDRILHSSVVFPVEYGFIPQTWFHDDDPLDIMVLSYEPLEVGCIVKVRPIGVLVLEDEKGEDPKILSVPISDPRFNGYQSLSDVHYKRLEPKKWVKFKAWRDREEAENLVKYAIDLFRQRFCGMKGEKKKIE